MPEPAKSPIKYALAPFSRKQKWWTAAMAALSIGFIVLTAIRISHNYSVPANEFDWENRGHSDFHNGIYYPTLAFRHGTNPYGSDVVDAYSMSRSAPLFSPFVFIFHLPFSFLELPLADGVFFVFNTLLLLALAYASIKFNGPFQALPFAFVCAFLVMSRPGHISLFTGYFTAELALGTVIALQFARTKPFVSGMGLLLASGKPNFVIPLVILMAFRRDWRALFIGLILCGSAAALGVIWLSSFTSLSEVVQGFQEGQEALHADETELPFNTWTRIDLTGMVAKVTKTNPGDAVYLAAMLGLLAIPGCLIFRLAKNGYQHGVSGLLGYIICLCVLLSIYHHTYDWLLLVVPWVGVTFFGSRILPELSGSERVVVSMASGLPAVNYLSTLMVRSRLNLDPDGWLWQGITLVNGVSLSIALLVLISAAMRQLPRTTANRGESLT